MTLAARIGGLSLLRRALAGAALLFLLAPAAAFAKGGQERDIEAGVYFGSMSPDSYDSLDPDNGTFWGIRGGYWFTPKWSVEGTWQSFSTEGDVAGSPSIDLNSLRANGLWNFRAGKKFRWFLTLGLGTEKVKSDDLDISESAFGWNYGGGARWFFGKSKFWGLRADARSITTDPGGDIDGSQTNFEVGGGLMFTWGGGTPPDGDGDKINDKLDKCREPRGEQSWMRTAVRRTPTATASTTASTSASTLRPAGPWTPRAAPPMRTATASPTRWTSAPARPRRPRSTASAAPSKTRTRTGSGTRLIAAPTPEAISRSIRSGVLWTQIKTGSGIRRRPRSKTR